MSHSTYRSAIRKVLHSTRTPDMDAVAREAIALMDDDLVIEAAVTHIRQMARKEWNALVTAAGSGLSTEVVNVRGEDTFLGATDEEERDWMARQREVLAAGLRRRAGELRAFDHRGALTTKEVLLAERRAAEARSFLSALERMTEGIGDGSSVIERDIAEQHARSKANEDGALSEVKALMFLLRRLTRCGLGNARRTRVAVRSAAQELGMPYEEVHDGEG